jgi:aconitate hydratase
MPKSFLVNDNLIEMPADPESAKQVTVERGPNIKPIPKGTPPAADLECELILKVGDNITTDHIMPAGAKILPYRSNIPYLSKFCFGVCDESFPERAKAAGSNIVLGGTNYGQGSSREHAALVPLYLGVKAVIAKSFARIHMANLINFGIVPMTLECEADYDKIAEGTKIKIDGFRDAIASGNRAYLTVEGSDEKIPLVLSFSERQREILLAGGTLNYTKKQK